MSDLINALKSQQQCDPDGVMCIVSRQAVNEAIAEIERLRVVIKLLEKDTFNLTEKVIPPMRKDAERWSKVRELGYWQPVDPDTTSIGKFRCYKMSKADEVVDAIWSEFI